MRGRELRFAPIVILTSERKAFMVPRVHGKGRRTHRSSEDVARPADVPSVWRRCDGSTPMCFKAGEYRVGAQDVLLGEIAGCEFYIARHNSNTGSIPNSLLTSSPDAVPASRLKLRRACAF